MVIDSRARPQGVLRRRQCECGERWSSVERLYSREEDAALKRIAKRMRFIESEMVELADAVKRLIGDRDAS